MIWCESRGDPWAYYQGNYGLMQINAAHVWRVGWNLENLYDPAVNLRVAWEIYQESGWTPWACKP